MKQKETLHSNQKEISALKNKLGILRNQITIANSDLDDCKSQITQLENTIRVKAEESTTARNTLNKLIMENEKLEKEIQSLEVDTEANQLLRNEPTFWDALHVRIDHLNRMNSGIGYSNLDSLQSTEEIIKKFKEYANNPKNLSNYAILLKSAENTYVDYQRSLCRKKVTGEIITVEDKQERINLLDRILHKPEISALWN